MESLRVYRPNGLKMVEIHFNAGEEIEESENGGMTSGEPVESQRQALGNNEEAISKATEASGKSLNSMKQLTLALSSYARDHDERFPAVLRI